VLLLSGPHGKEKNVITAWLSSSQSITLLRDSVSFQSTSEEII